jgi:two-component system response regulator AtoC
LKPSPLVLVVDDNEDIVTMLRHALTRHGFRIDTTTSPEEALEMAAKTVYDAALLDLVMPGRDGATLAAALREKTPGLPVGVLTAYTHSPLIVNLERSGVKVFLKPVAIQDLVDYLESELA